MYLGSMDIAVTSLTEVGQNHQSLTSLIGYCVAVTPSVMAMAEAVTSHLVFNHVTGYTPYVSAGWQVKKGKSGQDVDPTNTTSITINRKLKPTYLSQFHHSPS